MIHTDTYSTARARTHTRLQHAGSLLTSSIFNFFCFISWFSLRLCTEFMIWSLLLLSLFLVTDNGLFHCNKFKFILYFPIDFTLLLSPLSSYDEINWKRKTKMNRKLEYLENWNGKQRWNWLVLFWAQKTTYGNDFGGCSETMKKREIKKARNIIRMQMIESSV